MTRTYRVQHRTTYRYGATMTDGYTVACLVPRPTARQVVHESSVELRPTASEWDSYLDGFGNLVNQFGLHEPHAEMSVEATSVVETEPWDEPDDTTPWEQVVGQLDVATDELALEVGMFRARSAFVDLAGLGADLRAIADRAFTPGRPMIEATRALCTDINTGFEFDPHFSNVSTPLAEVLAARRGVCQDFAHLAVGCLRSVGLAARYVSGYIETVPPPGQERLVGADASHAWCSVWTPSTGWVDFDPTNDHLPVNDHVTVAWGRDYADVIPVRGVMIGPSTTQTLDVAVDVARI
ncbi:MAG TPA: transglutaminase family protein [Ilumatobacter sp.]|nr:transglutaminase family protein [Ilumatobacter sp.]